MKDGTLTSGNYGEDHVCLHDDVCYSVLINPGSYDNEVTWEIGKYGVGLVAAGAGENSPMGCQFSTNGFCTTTWTVDDDDDSNGACSGMPGSGSSYSLMLYDSAGDGESYAPRPRAPTPCAPRPAPRAPHGLALPPTR